MLLPLATPYQPRKLLLECSHISCSLFGVWKENWSIKGDYSTVWSTVRRHTFHCLPHTAVLHNTFWTGTVHYSWGTEQLCTIMYLHGMNQNTDQPILNVLLSLENPPSLLLLCYGTKLEAVFISTDVNTYDGVPNRRKRHTQSRAMILHQTRSGLEECSVMALQRTPVHSFWNNQVRSLVSIITYGFLISYNSS